MSLMHRKPTESEYRLIMLGGLAGALIGAVAVSWFVWEVKELSWASGGGKYEIKIPPVPPIRPADWERR